MQRRHTQTQYPLSTSAASILQCSAALAHVHFVLEANTTGIEAATFLLGAARIEQLSAGTSVFERPTRRASTKQRVVHIPTQVAQAFAKAHKVIRKCHANRSKVEPVQKPKGVFQHPALCDKRTQRFDRGPAAPSRSGEGTPHEGLCQQRRTRARGWSVQAGL